MLVYSGLWQRQVDGVKWKMAVWNSRWFCRVVDGCVECWLVVWSS